MGYRYKIVPCCMSNLHEVECNCDEVKSIPERPEWLVKIKGDAGAYKIWAIDWLNQKALVCRACGDEWVSLSKLTIAN
jgi:hypothetical protein